jgi:hypothetical protein
MTQIAERLMNPRRRAPFHELCNLGRRHRGWRADEHVNVILDSANLQRLQSIRPRDAAQVLSDPLLDLRPDPPLAKLRAEGEMIVQRRVRVCHGARPR